MCLAIPAKVVEIKGDTARVDFGAGTIREVNVSLVDAKIGEYVIVHAGYAIEVLDRKAAEETLALWNEILNKYEETTPTSRQ
jgi:hydrogenase expression/formation protein HypC